MHLFIALSLPEEERERIYAAAEPLRDPEFPIRWLDPSTYHLTLKFLGATRQEQLPTIEKAVARVADATLGFPVVLEGFGAFPTIRRPQVLWLGAEPSPALRCLKQDLEWGLASHGFERETRAFHPHVTVGRSARSEGAGSFRGLDGLAAEVDYRSTLPVTTVDIMRSQNTKEGVRYSVVSRVPLKVPQPSG